MVYENILLIQNQPSTTWLANFEITFLSTPLIRSMPKFLIPISNLSIYLPGKWHGIMLHQSITIFSQISHLVSCTGNWSPMPLRLFTMSVLVWFWNYLAWPSIPSVDHRSQCTPNTIANQQCNHSFVINILMSVFHVSVL